MDSIGRYQILGELGRGAMGIVYRALDPAIGRTVAIKTISLSEVADPSERTKLHDRLFREAQSAGVLSHPGIVTIYDIAEQDDVAYIAMECVDGPTLDRLMATSPPDSKLVLSLLTQTAAALDYAHKRGVVHRDIKPANIIVHDGTQAKITDFGVARIQSQQLTQAGLMVGTPNYMSPEQIQGKPVDGRSDQYSLAVIAFEMLTGEKPFSAETIPALAFKIVHDEPAPIHRLNSTLGWTVDTVIRKALSKNPDDRYSTCSDFVFALENACRSCKDWRPLMAGAVEQEATVVEARQGAAVAARQPTTNEDTPAARPLFSAEAEPPVPLVLRVARLLAMLIVGIGLAAALLVAGLRWFSGSPEPVAQVVEEPERAKFPKPSPMGESQLPATLPGDARDGTETQDQNPDPAVQEDTEQPPAARSEREAPEAPAAPPEQGDELIETRIVTNPPGAFVVVDGQSDYSCKSPCVLSLPPGRHTLATSMAGFRRSLRILNLPQDSENFVNLEPMTGTVIVRSEPAGAVIEVDGTARAQRTPAMLQVPTGRHRIDVILNGQRETQEVDVRDSAITNVSVRFLPR